MYRIWFERPLPAQYAPMLDGIAVAVEHDPADVELAGLVGAEGIIASARTRYDGALLDRVPTLRVIARTGIGVDNVSIPEATARGIAVCNTPEGPTISTAELAITLMLSVARQIKIAERDLRRGGQQDFFSAYTGMELHGRTLGLIGLGRIGGHVAKIALAFGMRVLAYDPYLPPERAAELGIEQSASLAAVLGAADIVSLHAPHTPETDQLINRERLAMMKPGAILINAARGGLVNETDLLAALESGHLSGAGLDVFAAEPPPPDHPLLGRDDVVATPHIAGATLAGKDRLWRMAIAQALQVLQGERPPHLLNPEVWTG